MTLTSIAVHGWPDHSKSLGYGPGPKEAAHGRHFTPQQQTHWWDVPFIVATNVCLLHFAIPFITKYLSSSACQEIILRCQFFVSTLSLKERI